MPDLSLIEKLHRPYWATPLDVLVLAGEDDAGIWRPEQPWRETTPFEQITGGWWQCDGCSQPAPCPTWLALDVPAEQWPDGLVPNPTNQEQL